MATREHFLVLHNDYQTTKVGLFNAFELLDSVACDNKQASKQLFFAIDALLNNNAVALADCRFLAANQGPGPFTTLRVVIASLNGLACATKLPLIGVNGIETFAIEQYDKEYGYMCVLSNAFCNDVYYAMIDTTTAALETGCVPYETVITMLKKLLPKSIKIVGNIANEKRIELAMLLGDTITIPDPCPNAASLTTIGQAAYRQWQETRASNTQLAPLYFKKAPIRSA